MKSLAYPTHGILNGFKRILNGNCHLETTMLGRAELLLLLSLAFAIIASTKHNSGIPLRHGGILVLNPNQIWADPSIIVRLWSAAVVALLMVGLLFFKQQNTTGVSMKTFIRVLPKLLAQHFYLVFKVTSLQLVIFFSSILKVR